MPSAKRKKKEKENVTGTLETMTDVLAKLVCKDETKERTKIREDEG